MVLSSIFQDIRIKEKKDVISFAEALETSKNILLGNRYIIYKK